MSGDVSWQLNGTRGNLRCGDLCASLDALTPARGLFDVHSAGRWFAGCEFLGVGIDAAAPDTLADFYHRGGDLIARYRQTPQRVFAVEVYWRAGLLPLGDGRFPYCDLLVSVETQLLHSHPLVVAQTRLAPAAGEDVIQGRDYCVARLADAAVSYVELCHPADALGQELQAAHEGVLLTTRLLGQPLEKGVILRSRLRGLFVSQADDDLAARAALADFASLPPPLTT
ncbi:MAG: hypothetical protein B7Z73_12305 [Planctomycetia bacterium 21-64-5]|nr:MAG: hypothetical protein B7Z73_12305 [Planctomycetia bacterium 21-64-5]HQU45056.1 hypothetical protein [Pirellulales bacterium]